MKTIPLIGLILAAQVASAAAPPTLGAINVTKRTPIQVANVAGLLSYAATNNYYFKVNLKAGMRVMYSASYGVGGEAAQAAGTIVMQNGRFMFQQDTNPSGNLLLPPGLPLNSSSQISLWDIGAYLDLINRVSFSVSNVSYISSNDVYANPAPALVDFTGGTAGGTMSYTNAMEVKFTKSLPSSDTSNLAIYYAQGVGPVALEFDENMEPAGTFYFYLANQ